MDLVQQLKKVNLKQIQTNIENRNSLSNKQEKITMAQNQGFHNHQSQNSSENYERMIHIPSINGEEYFTAQIRNFTPQTTQTYGSSEESNRTSNEFVEMFTWIYFK